MRVLSKSNNQSPVHYQRKDRRVAGYRLVIGSSALEVVHEKYDLILCQWWNTDRDRFREVMTYNDLKVLIEFLYHRYVAIRKTHRQDRLVIDEQTMDRNPMADTCVGLIPGRHELDEHCLGLGRSKLTVSHESDDLIMLHLRNRRGDTFVEFYSCADLRDLLVFLNNQYLNIKRARALVRARHLQHGS